MIEMDYAGKFTVLLPVSTTYDDRVQRNEEYHRKIEVLKEIIAILQDSDRGIIDLRL